MRPASHRCSILASEQAPRVGFEPTTLWLTASCSGQLSYQGKTSRVVGGSRIRYLLAGNQALSRHSFDHISRARGGIRTRCIQLGRLALNQMSFTRESPKTGERIERSNVDLQSTPLPLRQPVKLRHRDSNPEPLPYEGIALPVELWRISGATRIRTEIPWVQTRNNRLYTMAP